MRWGGVGCGGVACISLSELLGLRKTLKRVEKILRVVVTCGWGWGGVGGGGGWGVGGVGAAGGGGLG